MADYATKEYVDAADKTLQDAIDALKTGDIAKLKEDVKAAQAAADKAAADAEKANADIVETLKTLATKTELKDAADAAQKAIEALESKNAEDLKKVQDAITETLKSYATKSDVEDGDKKTLESLASTIKNASDALALANANKQAIADALDILGKGYSKENTVAAAIEAIKGQIGTPKKELGTLDSRLAAIEGVLNGVKDDETKLGLVAKVDNIENKLKDIIGEYTTMVTEVSLLGSYLSNGTLSPVNETALQFTSGTVGKDIIFGKAEKDAEHAEVPSATNQQTFVTGTTFNTESELVVRVNPTNAVLTKAAIKLVDSQGNSLDDFFEIGEPKKFDKLLTRASNNTGLWTIPVTVKDGVKRGDIEKKNEDGHILYAVAINNTSSEAAKDRYVISSHDITVPEANKFEDIANTNINDVEIWSETTMGNDHVKLGDALNKAEGTPGTTTNRIVSAKSGENIFIDFTKEYNHKVQYFYVVRDDSWVDETTSGSSAINAWKSYEYGGSAYGNVVEVNPAEKLPTLNVKINGVKGDKIGFRIFAIRYDGEVMPANGASFVVYVGENENQASVKGDLVAENATGDNETGWLPLTGTLKDGASGVDVASSFTFTEGGVSFTPQFAQDANGLIAPTKNSEIKYVKFKTNTPMTDWKDGSTINHTIIQKDGNNMVKNQIAVSLTKKLPTAADAKTYTWKDNQLVNGVYTAYVTPGETATAAGNPWRTDADKGHQNMTQAISNLKAGFEFKIENVEKDANDKYTKPATFSDDDDWTVAVDKALIDGTTQHKTTISYNYGKISSVKDAEGNYVPWKVPVETIQTVFACPLTKKDQSYAWAQGKIGEDANHNAIMADVNYLTYGSNETAKVKDDAGNDVNANLLEYIIGTNKYYNTEFGGTLKNLVYGATNFMAKYRNINVKLISNVSGEVDYFDAEIAGAPGNAYIEFTQKSNTTNPVADVKSTLVITLTDAFGCDQTYMLPFTVKRAQ